jgi:hypothetical protein
MGFSTEQSEKALLFGQDFFISTVSIMNVLAPQREIGFLKIYKMPQAM